IDGSHLELAWRKIIESDGAKASAARAQASFMSIYIAGQNGWFAQDAAYAYDLESVLKRLKRPVMLLTYPGQKLHQAAIRLGAMRPDFAVKTLDWDGTAASFDKPELWSDSIADYLKSDR